LHPSAASTLENAEVESRPVHYPSYHYPWRLPACLPPCLQHLQKQLWGLDPQKGWPEGHLANPGVGRRAKGAERVYPLHPSETNKQGRPIQVRAHVPTIG